MSEQTPLSPVRKLALAGLIVAAAGIVIQIVSGVDYPTIPPGLIILLVAAGLMAARRWWTAAIGVAMALLILVGFFVTSGTTDRLTDTSDLGRLVGTAVQLGGLVMAVVVGAVATVRGFQVRSPTVTRERSESPRPWR